ncbi:hypothetical protein OIU84_017327 [Salix udensis]|uniref:Poly A polymerase head domain-containing protein n=1 Tax=Salix udensis TaxID=889485 RepID=A0AAD6L1T9_9ROSI|nr:hypothetical protein OIU84_017327 [Salix udensis]
MRPLFNTVKLDPLRLFFSPNLLIRRKTTFVSLPSFTCPNKTLTRIQTPGVFHCKEMATVSSESAAGAVVQVKDKIELTEVEKQIFDRFVNTLRHFSLHTELRVAGGWVRDKLLGKECYDIDIAIDNMSGSEFVDKVREYLLSTGEEAHGVGIIPRNPDQSKHLETARMRLLDLWIDFVNLRSEDYSENSRIPTMTFGTAKEDAYRRDLTINSLFYNINTGSVEDLTGRGIEDLKSGKIVTPLPPKDTFLDDPLRVLRAIRFGASKERVGTEVDLMISGNQPVKAMTYIADLTLFWVVFTLHPKVEPTVSEECQGLCVAYLDAAWNLIQLIGGSSFTGEQRRLCLYAALFLPFRDTIYKDGKGKKVPVVNYIFRDSLKQKASDPETVIKIHSLLKWIWAWNFYDVPITSKLRVATGFLLLEVKEFWRAGLLLSTLLYPSDTDSTQDFLEKQFELDRRRDLFKAAEDAIVNQGLEKVWDLKPLVNGKDIMNVLHLKSGGPIVREWQQKLLAWQLAHPAGTVEECLDWMKETHSKRAKME